jgi:NTE family protein
MAARTLGEWLDEGPFTLGLSSGFFGFFAHAGVLAALEEQGLRPAALAGSSAGALVAGCWAAGLDAHALTARLATLRTEEFWDPAPAFGLLELGLVRVGKFAATLRSLIGEARFAATRAPLAISTFDVLARRTFVLDRGPLVPAIVASCSVPLLFQPVRHEGRLLSDGGIADRPGLAGVSPGVRVLHHHLASRSPWRRPGDPALAPPSRPNLVALVLRDLPRSGPHRLEAGVRAMALAHDAAKVALDAPLGPVVERRVGT